MPYSRIERMKVAVYNTHKFEKDYLIKANNGKNNILGLGAFGLKFMNIKFIIKQTLWWR